MTLRRSHCLGAPLRAEALECFTSVATVFDFSDMGEVKGVLVDQPRGALFRKIAPFETFGGPEACAVVLSHEATHYADIQIMPISAWMRRKP